ncbi:MAG: ATP-grasp domain-containing protein [Desulfobacterales bacterium]
MQSENRLLVVGTTSDYIDWIRRTCPQRALFITDPFVRSNAREPAPATHEEVLCELADNEHVRKAVTSHLERWNIRVDGVACFDCESMALAALLAQDFSAAFVSLSAVKNCRDKLLSKSLWQQNGIICPRIAPARHVEDAIDFLLTTGRDCVLKPLSGSGSELVFRCKTKKECRRAFAVIQNGLQQRKNHRLYNGISNDSPSIIVEEFVDGLEFSCDFFMDEETATLIRLTKKIPSWFSPFGTTMGYMLVDALPQDIDLQMLCRYLARSADTLGIYRSICMADFMVREGEIILLEMTPRPGGDCLPALIRNALKLDILALTLDAAQKRPLHIGSFCPPQPFAGLRIHARQGGIFRRIDVDSVKHNPRIKEIHVLRRPGDIIRMPPEDYDSFVLGNIIFTPENTMNLMHECRRLLDMISVEIESP